MMQITHDHLAIKLARAQLFLTSLANSLIFDWHSDCGLVPGFASEQKNFFLHS